MNTGQVNPGTMNAGNVNTAFSMYAFKKAAENQKKTIITLIQSMNIPEPQKSNLVNLLA
jgi:hypothetical protein